MKISTKGRFVTSTAFATIALIAAMIWWARAEVIDSDRQHLQMGQIERALVDLRHVTFEYTLHRIERARLQEREVSKRLEGLLANDPFPGLEQAEAFAGLRARVATAHRLFAELVAPPGPGSAKPPDTEVTRQFEAQLTSRMLILEQEGLASAFLLSNFASTRINTAQQRVMQVILAGLALIALSTWGIAALIHRDVLIPMRRLQAATHAVAVGDWNFKLDSARDDEIGDVSRNFNAMTQSLRESFTHIERSNHELTSLNQEIQAFSYSVSHDLRGPLRSMDGFSLALLEDYGDKFDDEAKDSLQRIRAASQRMGRLIDDLLRLSRVTRAELTIKPVDLSAIAREIAASLREHQPERSVQWEIENNVIVQADNALMQIAMQNLLENAWKFTGKTEKAVIRVGTMVREGRKFCFVADNGVGFDMAYVDRLFGAFQRLHHEADFPGTGIGLAMVQRIVRRHGGEIGAQAQPALGATFFFHL